MIPNPVQTRVRLRAALCHLGRQQATVYRPDRDAHGGLLDTQQPIGRVAGYPYSKARTTPNIVIAMPGQLDEGDPSVSHLMVLYAAREDRELGPTEYDPPDTQKDDVLMMATGAQYRVLSAQDVLGGAYRVYRIKEM